MKFSVLTLFPKQVKDFLSESIIGRAEEKGILSIETVDIRDFAGNRYGKVDDTLFGGGTGNGVKYSIVADGDEVCFIEFGAGVYADGSKGFAPQASQSLGFRVAPGSWSMSPEGSKEFLKTDAADQYGYDKGPIPLADWEYNQEARMGLWRAYTEILASFDEVGKEVFLDTNWGE